MAASKTTRLSPIVLTPEEPGDKTVLWIDSSAPERPVAKAPHNGEFVGIIGEKGDKGDKGDPPRITADEDGTLYSEGRFLTDVVKTSSQKAIVAAEQADAAREGIQDDLAKKLDADTIVLLSDIEYQILVDTGQVDPDKMYYVYEAEEPEP